MQVSPDPPPLLLAQLTMPLPAACELPRELDGVDSGCDLRRQVGDQPLSRWRRCSPWRPASRSSPTRTPWWTSGKMRPAPGSVRFRAPLRPARRARRTAARASGRASRRRPGAPPSSRTALVEAPTEPRYRGVGSSRSPYMNRLTSRWTRACSGWKTPHDARDDERRDEIAGRREHAPIRPTARHSLRSRPQRQDGVDGGAIDDQIQLEEAVPEDRRLRSRRVARGMPAPAAPRAREHAPERRCRRRRARRRARARAPTQRSCWRSSPSDARNGRRTTLTRRSRRRPGASRRQDLPSPQRPLERSGLSIARRAAEIEGGLRRDGSGRQDLPRTSDAAAGHQRLRPQMAVGHRSRSRHGRTTRPGSHAQPSSQAATRPAGREPGSETTACTA